MDNCRRPGTELGHIGANGLGGNGGAPDLSRHGQAGGDHAEPKRHRNYRLIIDPALKQGPKKVYSYDGVVLGEAMPVIVRDPRSRMSRSWGKREVANLPIPNFKYDQHYVGTILPKEVTFCNLNNNVNQSFLRDMCKGFGNVEEVVIYYHPKSRRHLGIGMVLFTSTKSARLCAEKYNQTTTMGNIMTVFVDAMGQERSKLIESATAEKSTGFLPPSPKSKLPADVLGQQHHPTPVDDFRSPKKLLETRTPSSGSLDPRSHLHSDRSSSLSGTTLCDWSHGGTVDLLTPTVEASSFMDFNYAPPLPSDASLEDDMSLPPPLPPEPFPFNGFVGYDLAGSQTNARCGFAAQEPAYVSGNPRYDSNHRHDRRRHHRTTDLPRNNSFHDREEVKWDLRRNGQQQWEPGWKKTPYDGERHRHHPENSAAGSSHGQDATVLEHSCDSWDAYRREETSLPVPDHAATVDSDTQYCDDPTAEADEDDDKTKPLQSLESRIQAMLAQDGTVSFLNLHATATDDEEPRSPWTPDGNLTLTSLPPLPPEDDAPLPPLPSEDDPPLPPLPPEPDSGTATGLHPTEHHLPSSVDHPVHESESASLADNHEESRLDLKPDSSGNGVTFTVGDDDDDRMSMSSLSSGEDKVEVIEMNVEVSGYSIPWMLHNNYLNNEANQLGTMPFMYGNAGGPFTRFGDPLPESNQEEPEFEVALNEIIAELKTIMGKDLRKRMIESAAFKSLESWWKMSEAMDKNQNLKLASFPADRLLGLSAAQARPSSSAAPSTLSSSGSSHQMAFRAPDTASTTLASLFDNSDSGHFGVGGLLGLRGAMPKMPSFKKKFHPPSPPPVEEDDVDEEDADESFKGPHTPEDSENEEKDKISDESSLESDGEGVLCSKVKSTRKVIYTDSSDSESEKAESDAEDADEEEPEMGEVSDAITSEGSDEEAEELDNTREEANSSDGEEEEEEEEEENQEERGSSSSLHLEDGSSPMASGNKIDLESEKLPLASDQEKVSSFQDRAELKADECSEDVNVDELSEAENNVLAVKWGIESADEALAETVADEKKTSRNAALRSLNDKPVVLLDDSVMNVSDRIETTSISDAEVDVVSVPNAAAPGDMWPAEEALGVAKPLQPLLSPLGVAAAAEHNYFSTGETASKRHRKDRRTVASLSTELPHVIDIDTDPLPSSLPMLVPSLPMNIEIDHNYCRRFLVPDDPQTDSPAVTETSVVVPFHAVDLLRVTPPDSITADDPKHHRSKPPKPRSQKPQLFADMTNMSGSRELASLFPYLPAPPRHHFTPRTHQQELETACDFLIKGIDQEDVLFLKRRYEELLQDDSVNAYWLNDTHWVDHLPTYAPDPSTLMPPTKKRKFNHRTVDTLVSRHLTGSARTEGYYKISHQEKRGYLCHARGVNQSQENEQSFELDPASQTKKKVQQSREARSESRRWQSVLGSLGEDVGDLLKFNQLKFRKKQLKFARSSIHDWGLFALEPIQEGEMVIEYVGQVIRQSVADLREKRYEALGIGSSYLFRVDGDAIVDATKYGNLARFINHSCSPNCCAKIVTVESLKKIVIYSKRDIGVREEITYDYKFPLEEDKIRCLCGAVGCRGSLN